MMENLDPPSTPKIKDYGSVSRLKFLRSGLMVGIIAQLIFVITNNLSFGTKLPVASDVAALLAFVGIYAASFKSRHNKLLFNITIAVIAVVTVLSFYDASASRAIFLAPITILIAYLLLSRIGGIVWTALFGSAILGAYYLDKFDIAKLLLDPELMIYGVISIVVISILLYVYEGVNVTNKRIIAKRETELLSLNKYLNQQLAYNKHTAAELSHTLDTAQKNNKVLSDTKKAILNILEDSNELQTQLKQEKVNVEHTVMVRTEQLREEQGRLRASINSLGSGFLMTFLDDKEVIFNPALQALLDLKEDDSTNLSHKTSSYIKLLQDKLGTTFDLIKAIKVSQETAEPFTKDGIELGKKIISISGAPITLEGRKDVSGCVLIFEDRTDAMMLERSKSEFISIASHELRTPLTAIRGNASMLMTMYADALPDGDAKSMIADIKDASVRLIGIVNQFLSTSRLEQKRTVFIMKPVNIAKSILTSVKELTELAKERKLSLTAEIPEDLPEVMADDARTGEIIVNIIGNAIKYTEVGSVHVVARVIDGFVEVDVTDTGLGIEPKNQALLFHKFQQATSDILTRDDSRSTGLGLYITKLLVEQMGGVIYLKKSELGHGSTFTFTLPIAKPST